MKTPRLIITIKNGIVQHITANTNIEIKILDYDVQDTTSPVLSDTYEPDIISNQVFFDGMLNELGHYECSGCGGLFPLDRLDHRNNDGGYCDECK